MKAPLRKMLSRAAELRFTAQLSGSPTVRRGGTTRHPAYLSRGLIRGVEHHRYSRFVHFLMMSSLTVTVGMFIQHGDYMAGAECAERALTCGSVSSHPILFGSPLQLQTCHNVGKHSNLSWQHAAVPGLHAAKDTPSDQCSVDEVLTHEQRGFAARHGAWCQNDSSGL